MIRRAQWSDSRKDCEPCWLRISPFKNAGANLSTVPRLLGSSATLFRRRCGECCDFLTGHLVLHPSEPREFVKSTTICEGERSGFAALPMPAEHIGRLKRYTILAARNQLADEARHPMFAKFFDAGYKSRVKIAQMVGNLPISFDDKIYPFGIRIMGVHVEKRRQSKAQKTDVVWFIAIRRRSRLNLAHDPISRKGVSKELRLRMTRKRVQPSKALNDVQRLVDTTLRLSVRQAVLLTPCRTSYLRHV